MVETFDKVVLDFFQNTHSDIFTLILRLFALIGEGGCVWIIVGLVMVFAIKDKKYGIIVLASLLLCFIFGNVLLKNIVARPRPCWVHPEVPMLIGIPKDYSFPSGHTFSSIAASIGVYHWNRKWGIASFAVACFIIYSRMYFFVHYPTDVLGGIVLGIMNAGISIRVVEILVTRKQRKKCDKSLRNVR